MCVCVGSCFSHHHLIRNYFRRWERDEETRKDK